jgi:hypothetical protein
MYVGPEEGRACACCANLQSAGELRVPITAPVVQRTMAYEEGQRISS